MRETTHARCTSGPPRPGPSGSPSLCGVCAGHCVVVVQFSKAMHIIACFLVENERSLFLNTYFYLLFIRRNVKPMCKLFFSTLMMCTLTMNHKECNCCFSCLHFIPLETTPSSLSVIFFVYCCPPPDPPGFPRIQDKFGRRLEGPIGPYEDGTAVRMMCLSSGGECSSVVCVAVTAEVMWVSVNATTYKLAFGPMSFKVVATTRMINSDVLLS